MAKGGIKLEVTPKVNLEHLIDALLYLHEAFSDFAHTAGNVVEQLRELDEQQGR